MEHVDPKTGTYRLTGSRSVPVIAGFDATFCAPKSVALLFALGEPEVSNEVRNAHDAAQGAALEVLERAACRVRRGQGGQTVLTVTGSWRLRSGTGPPGPVTRISTPMW